MTEGDTELRDLVSQTLENAGVLAKIRAELRASVFLVLEEHESFKGRNLSFTNKPLKDFLSTQEGIITVNLVKEFLDFFGLEFTSSVFEPETHAGKDYEYVGRSQLAQDLKLNSGRKAPLIAQVLQESKVCFASAVPAPKDTPSENVGKKDKVKDDKKNQENSNLSLKMETTIPHSNGLMKPTESPSREANVDSKLSMFGNSPPFFQNHAKKPDSLKLDVNQSHSPKPLGSSLSSLGGLPPLGMPQNSQTNKSHSNRPTRQTGLSSDIKALLDLGSDSLENNYEEDFNPSGSEKTSKGTNRSSGSGSEIDEEMSVGADDQASDHSGSNGSGKISN